jgi:DNA-binding NtrC family response regulator
VTLGGTGSGDTIITTSRGAAAGTTSAGHLQLLIVGTGTILRHPLPEAGDVSIGRSDQCDVRVDEPSVSRRHAVIHLGPPLTIEDLDSANGTRVRGEALHPGVAVALDVGESAELGSVMLMVQLARVAAQPRRMWTHGHFEVRLEEEVARARHRDGALGVLRIHCDRSAQPRVVQEALASLLKPTDVIGCYGPLEYEAILIDARPEHADAITRRLTEGLAARGVPGKVGIACYPRDGSDPFSLVERACALARGEAHAGGPAGVIIVDPAMRQLYQLVERVAASNISVLILGETGSGKEVVAEAVHRFSPRASAPFLRLNCAALTDTLLESELFGHERGSFTGATQAKPGLLETAQGGTVFLDEIGELPLATQVKLLRVLEERQVLRVGALKARPIDVRFISATNRDLEAETSRGTFRQDLFFRLNGFSLVVPPLRDRNCEISALAHAFAARAARDTGLVAPPAITPEALCRLQRYSWPGNIRELRNVIERAVLLAGGEAIRPEHLPLEKMYATLVTPEPPRSDDAKPALAGPELTPRPTRPEWMMTEVPTVIGLAPRSRPATGGPAAPAPPVPPPGDGDLPSAPEAVGAPLAPADPRLADDPEYRRIVEALGHCAGNQTHAARLLGISRRTLVYRLDEYGIARPRKNRGPREP